MCRDREQNGGRRTRAAVLALYLAAFLAPAHGLLEGAGHCSECEDAGPVFLAACTGPESCPDPQHHHHDKPHRHGQCPVCQKSQVPALQAARAVGFENTAGVAEPASCLVASLPRPLRALRSHPARAPPVS
jgi:hypothetical protein